MRDSGVFVLESVAEVEKRSKENSLLFTANVTLTLGNPSQRVVGRVFETLDLEARISPALAFRRHHSKIDCPHKLHTSARSAFSWQVMSSQRLKGRSASGPIVEGVM